MRLAAIAVLSLLACAAPASADDARVPLWFVRAGGGPAMKGFVASRAGSWWTVGAGVRPRTWLTESVNLGWAHLPTEQAIFSQPRHRPFDAGSITIESAFSLPLRRGVTPFVSAEAGIQRSHDAGIVTESVAIPDASETAACSEFAIGIAVLPISGHGRVEASGRIRRTLSAHPWSMGGLRLTWAY